jgi:peptide deformylase
MFSCNIVTDKMLLHRKSAPYEFIDKHHPDELSEHIRMMVKENNAFGISGIQFNYPFRVFGVYTTDSKFEVLFNPELISIADETLIDEEEGCLSFPGLILRIKRPKSIVVRYQNEDQEWISNQLDVYYARGFLHELDHLNGILFTDNVSPLLLNIAKRRHAKLAKRRARR